MINFDFPPFVRTIHELSILPVFILLKITFFSFFVLKRLKLRNIHRNACIAYDSQKDFATE